MAKKHLTGPEIFVERWRNRGEERSDCQAFWLDLLRMVLREEEPADVIAFEKTVNVGQKAKKRIDAYIAETRVLIEQKSSSVSLDDTDDTDTDGRAAPFAQAMRYNDALPYDEKARWIVTCNFREFRVYDMNRPFDAPEKLLLDDIATHSEPLHFLIDKEARRIVKETEVSKAAGERVGELSDGLIGGYKDIDEREKLRSLNILCVRLVFCMYADNAAIFSEKGLFLRYIESKNAREMRRALHHLFKVLDTKSDERDPYLADDDPLLAAFPYVNGGLFRDENVEIPPFNDEMRALLIRQAGSKFTDAQGKEFDWAGISPTIFGAIFESTLNPATRREGGMHYTSIENIHKVIDPLFLDDLRHDLHKALQTTVTSDKAAMLIDLQQRMAELQFLDPACGSGNFLTETYLSLRRIENTILSSLLAAGRQIAFEDGSPVRVRIEQMAGIEVNDFAVTVANTALWIAENQMLRDTERIIGAEIHFLPLTSHPQIVEGNALRTDWNTLEGAVDPFAGTLFAADNNNKKTRQYDYIIGNPPFVGYSYQSKEQKADVLAVFGKAWKNVGTLDYVACWYKKAADLIRGTGTRCALVSTNSVTQGESVANLWKPLFAEGLLFDFAHRTFRWDSESTDKAHVHCVIIGFSFAPNDKPKVIYDGKTATEAKNINGYLVDAENVFIDRRSEPISSVPAMTRGSQPADGGFLILTKAERDGLVKQEPQAEKFIRPFMMGKDFIARHPRYCLWLVDANPAELKQCKQVMKRIEGVRDSRLKSPKAATRKCAATPTLSQEVKECATDYVAIPVVSSEKRSYIPIDYLKQKVIAGNKLFMLPSATLYHFGILTSSVHMAWMRAVCGRLKSDYRYSKDIVYNNFPWPETTAEAEARIGQTAQGILDARALFPEASLADLYDELTMPPALRRAHEANDRAVLALYGFKKDTPEPEIVAALMRQYNALTKR